MPKNHHFFVMQEYDQRTEKKLLDQDHLEGFPAPGEREALLPLSRGMVREMTEPMSRIPFSARRMQLVQETQS